jgi:hypothetical protein
MLAPSEKIEPTNVVEWKLSVGFPFRGDWLDSGSVLSLNSVTFYTDGSIRSLRDSRELRVQPGLAVT